jgi:hypothetical protein
MVLLVGFGLLLRSLLHVESSSIGYDPDNVLTAMLRLPPSRYTDPLARARLIRETLDRPAQCPELSQQEQPILCPWMARKAPLSKSSALHQAHPP